MAHGLISTLELISEGYIIKITGILSHITELELQVPGGDQENYQYRVPLNNGNINLRVMRLEPPNDRETEPAGLGRPSGQVLAAQEITFLLPTNRSA